MLSQWLVFCCNGILLWCQTQLDIDKALSEDPSVFEYDSVYDDMQGQKTQQTKTKKMVDNKVCVCSGCCCFILSTLN